MTSDRAVPFATRQEFRNQTIPWRPDSFSYEARRGSPPRVTDMTGEGVVKSEEEMEAMSRTLYAIIEIGDEMRPQEEL